MKCLFAPGSIHGSSRSRFVAVRIIFCVEKPFATTFFIIETFLSNKHFCDEHQKNVVGGFLDNKIQQAAT